MRSATGALTALAFACALLMTAPPVLGRASRPPHPYRAARGIADPRDTQGPLDLTSVAIGQDGRDLVLGAHTRGRIERRALAGRRGGSICFTVSTLGTAATRACFTGASGYLAAASVSATGTVTARRRVAAAVAYGPRSASARLAPAALGLRPGPVRWQVTSSWAQGPGCSAAPCVDGAPGSAPASFRIAPTVAVGCRVPHGGYVTNGPRRRRVVALTFDDGPSAYTPRILSVLRRAGVPATFFLIGRQVGPFASLARDEVAAGDVVGDHSWDHANLAGGGPAAVREISSTAIRRDTGFAPCLLRAPYGAVSRKLIADAAREALATIQWDVDPRDWSRPGAAAIYSRIVASVRPGSIVLMHDGGGPRDQTVAALPRLIATLRARGFAFATVPGLLGDEVVYGR